MTRLGADNCGAARPAGKIDACPQPTRGAWLRRRPTTVRALRGHPVKVTMLSANHPPQPVTTLVGMVGGQQCDDDWNGVTHTRIRRNGPAGRSRRTTTASSPRSGAAAR